MQFTRTQSPRPALEASYALLRCDGLNLLLPQQDIRLLELSSDVVADAPPMGGVGWIAFRQAQVPVFSLTQDLQWHTGLQSARPICALLESSAQYFGLLCSEAGLVRAGEIMLYDVPRAMVAAQAPFDRLALHGEQLACVSSAAQLFAYLPATVRSAASRMQEAR